MNYPGFNFTPYETHWLVYRKIAPGSNVLDIGCSSGYFAKELKKKNCRVWGIEIEKKAGKIARKYCQKVIIDDIERVKELPFKKNFFDYVLFLDILEHLKSPHLALKLVKPYLKRKPRKGEIIISVPNVAFISVRMSLFFGHFDYQKEGILDKSHLHFYTKETFSHFLTKECGLKIKEWEVASAFSQIPWFGRYLNWIPKHWQYRITRLWENLLAYQFIAMTEFSESSEK